MIEIMYKMVDGKKIKMTEKEIVDFNKNKISEEQYLEKLEKEEKQKDIEKLKEITEKGEKNLAKFRAIENIDEAIDTNKQYKLELIDKKGKEIQAEYLKLEAELIEKYGIEILEELL